MADRTSCPVAGTPATRGVAAPPHPGSPIYSAFPTWHLPNQARCIVPHSRKKLTSPSGQGDAGVKRPCRSLLVGMVAWGADRVSARSRYTLLIYTRSPGNWLAMPVVVSGVPWGERAGLKKKTANPLDRADDACHNYASCIVIRVTCDRFVSARAALNSVTR